MKTTLNWLKDFVDIDMTPQALGNLLTMIGLEVETIEPVGQALEQIQVARIQTITSHPKADRLFLCDVDTGKECVQVVCGATNLEQGAMVPLALPGASLPDGTKVKETRIREKVSFGMLLAEDEMGLTDDHSGIMILPHTTEPGALLSSVAPVVDWVFDIAITPNRPDCASVIGIAREIAAATGKKIKRPSIEFNENGPPIDELTSVTIEDPDGCPRYAAGMVRDVHLSPSPFWMRYRLHHAGMRGINNVVDISNYVMLEMGQPLHSFDYNRLKENRILVRRAHPGEKFTTLDEEERVLSAETLMICDGERPVAIAGIMGGLNSEIYSDTKDVLIESAFFDPVTIRRGSKHLELSTEASYRFERGADINGVIEALHRTISLLVEMAGGKVAAGIIDNYPKTYEAPIVNLRVDKTNQLLGTSISTDSIKSYLNALEMAVQETHPNELQVIPPSFRVDIYREVDLIEEVARLNGYENIPITYPHIWPSDEKEAPEILLRDRMRSAMVGYGFTEAINYSFISPELMDSMNSEKTDQQTDFVKLLNPLTKEQSVMRTSLVPGLLLTIRTNLQHDEKVLRFFEWGKGFFEKKGEQLPDEKIFLTAALAGLVHPKSWYSAERQTDFYDIKGVIEGLLGSVGIHNIRFQKDGEMSWYAPEYSAAIFSSDCLLGQMGRISPRVKTVFELEKNEAYVFELDINAILSILPKELGFTPFAKFPAVYRDISLIVDCEMTYTKIEEVIKQEGGELIESIQVFDLYEGERIASSEKALAFKISYRSTQGTLDGEEINKLHDSIITAIRRETGGRLREG